MNFHPEKDWKCAQAYYNGQLFVLFTCSGRSTNFVDDLGYVSFLQNDASNFEIGFELIKCFSKTRFLSSEESKIYLSKNEIIRKRKWLHSQLCNYMKEKRFKTLKERLMYVQIHKSDLISKSAYSHRIQHKPEDNLTFLSTRNLLGSDWGNIQAGYDAGVIAHNYPCPPAELGALLREAFKRCEGVGRDEIEFPEPLPD
ncbi:contact-dependent growth inhibition system immunity protein [Sphingorhabdus sp.]|uniref:contact-dependent growth inhibition system immunity protein n=1 Tax=Sphingorhabdus sp. TaxID=1902408 RepID=UPI0035946389